MMIKNFTICSLLIFFYFSFNQRINAQTNPCVKIESILVDACAPTVTVIIIIFPTQVQQEGDNEMFRFRVGDNALNISDMNVNWPGVYDWAGARMPDNVTAQKTAELNATVESCGVLLEPENGVLPANSKVLLICSYTASATTNSFADLSDTLYVVYQNITGRNNGHVLNYQANPDLNAQTLVLDFGPNCIDSVTYFRTSLINQNGNPGAQDGATVLFDDEGNPTYINNGCQAPVTSLSAEWSLPAGDGLICQNDEPIDLNLLITGTTGGEWTGDGLQGSVFDPSGLNGTFNITYSVGLGDCIAQETKPIVVNPPANAEWLTPDPICVSSAETINLDSLVSGTEGGVFSGQGVQNNIFDPSGLAGIIEVTYTVGVGTCEVANTNSISLVNVLPPVLTSEQNEYCENEIPFDIVAQAIETAEVFWYSEEELTNIIGTGLNISPVQDQSATYFAIQQLGDCQSDASSIDIIFNPAPETLEGIFQYTLCPGDEIPEIVFLTTENLNWYLDSELTNLVSTGIGYQPDDETEMLYVIAENEFCKSEPYIITIDKLELVEVSISLDGNEILCNNEQVTLISSAETGNIWSTTETTQEITVSETGLYILTYEGPCNTSMDSIQIQNQSVFADFTADPEIGNIPFNVNLNNNSENANQYDWLLNNNPVEPTNGVIEINETGTIVITLIARNEFGCMDTTFKTIEADEKLFSLVIPNSFTPNGDGFNDFFKVQSSGITSFKAVIYNRWGQAIHEWSGADNGWDGNSNGRKSPDGVYFYIITAEDFEGNEILKQGDITLKR